MIVLPAIERAARGGPSRSAARIRPTRCSTSGAAASTTSALCMYHDQALIPLKTLHFKHRLAPPLSPTPAVGAAAGLDRSSAI